MYFIGTFIDDVRVVRDWALKAKKWLFLSTLLRKILDVILYENHNE